MSERSARNAGVKSAAGAFSWPAGRDPLRRSIGGMLAIALFIAACGTAVWLTMASQTDARVASTAALGTVGALGWLARQHWRRQPVAIEIGRDGIVLWQTGSPRGHWHELRGAVVWPGLLGLRLRGCDGRVRTVLVPADALSAEAFHRLAVVAAARRARAQAPRRT